MVEGVGALGVRVSGAGLNGLGLGLRMNRSLVRFRV